MRLVPRPLRRALCPGGCKIFLQCDASQDLARFWWLWCPMQGFISSKLGVSNLRWCFPIALAVSFASIGIIDLITQLHASQQISLLCILCILHLYYWFDQSTTCIPAQTGFWGPGCTCRAENDKWDICFKRHDLTNRKTNTNRRTKTKTKTRTCHGPTTGPRSLSTRLSARSL